VATRRRCGGSRRQPEPQDLLDRDGEPHEPTGRPQLVTLSTATRCRRDPGGCGPGIRWRLTSGTARRVADRGGIAELTPSGWCGATGSGAWS